MKRHIKKTPEILFATKGDLKGEVNLQWEPVEKAKYYIIQAANGMNKWKEIDITTKALYTAARLKSGKKYSFRVAAITSEGQCEWSEPAEKRVP